MSKRAELYRLIVWQMVIWGCDSHGFIYRGFMHHTRAQDLMTWQTLSPKYYWSVSDVCWWSWPSRPNVTLRQAGNALWALCLGEKVVGRYSHGHNVRGSYKLPKMVKAENFGHVSWFRENQQPGWLEAQPLLDWVWVLDFPWPHLRLGCRGGSQAELGLLNACASAIRDPLSLLPELALSLPVFRNVTLPQPTMLMCAWEKKMKLKWCFRNSFIM